MSSDNDVTQPRALYIDMLPGVQKNRAAVNGERAIKKAGTVFLPPLASMCVTTCYDANTNLTTYQRNAGLTTEGQAAYNKYLSLASFYGATGITVDGLTGLIFSKPAVKDLPTPVDYLSTDVDGKGTSLRVFSKMACREGLIAPFSGVLVARPDTPEGSSQADVEAQNIRPKLLHYPFESIINWDYETVNNLEKLSLLVLKESTTKRKGFKVEDVVQYRVLELIEGVYHQSLYDNEGSVIELAMPVVINGAVSDEIPFFTIVTGGVINELVDMNIHHYQVGADYNAKNHYSSFTIYYETGAMSDQNMLIGNGVKWSNPSSDATFGVLQPDGNADALRLSLQDDEQRMAALGAEALKPRTSGAESAEAKTLDRVAQNATTADIAITVSESITKAINFASKWMGGDDSTVYQLNTDYNPTGLSAQGLTALVAAWQGDAISKETLHQNLIKGEVMSPEKTVEEEQKLIDNEGAGI